MAMDLTKMIGYKFFKENKETEEIESIRLLKYYKVNSDIDSIKILNLNTKEEKICDVKYLESYKPLQPEGMIMMSGVELDGVRDVIISGYLMSRLEKKDIAPFCVCRQCITDIYYNLLANDDSEMIAGMSMNILNIPKGFDYGMMFMADELLFSNVYMIYKDDTVNTLLETFKEDIEQYDVILEDLYTEHAKTSPSALFDERDKGWCRNLKTLLEENNFQSDLDEMMGITTVEFEIANYLVESKISEDSKNKYTTITDELRYWLSYLYKLDINKVYVIEYDNDIDFEEDFKKSRYFIFRDNKNKLYVFVYTLGEEYKEAELEEKNNQLDFSTKFRISYLDKYRNLHETILNDKLQ